MSFPTWSLHGAVPDQDRHLIRKALSARPEDRFDDAAAFLDALDEGQGGPVRVRRARPGTDAVPEVAAPRRSGSEEHRERRGFASIAGMDALKRTLIEDVVKPLRDPEKYRRFGVGIPNGLLLYGPPGCGKTFFAECLGEEIGFAFRAIRPSDVGSTFVHGSQGKVARLFETARKQAPCVLFLDEVDALIPAREGNLHQHYAAEVSEWLTWLNRAADDNVFVIAATNRPERIDPAAMRTGRLDRVFRVAPPDHAARQAMFELHLRGRPLDGPVDCADLAALTDGWMASDIRFLVDEAARAALAEAAAGITEAHLRGAIQRNSPSVSRDRIAEYERFHARFDRAGDARPPRRQIGFEASPAPAGEETPE